jgi:hypothetical protein
MLLEHPDPGSCEPRDGSIRVLRGLRARRDVRVESAQDRSPMLEHATSPLDNGPDIVVYPSAELVVSPRGT